jgi:hypothetical protein
MNTRPAFLPGLTAILAVALPLATASSACAGFYSSTSFAVFQGTSPISASKSGTSPAATSLTRELGGNKVDTSAAANPGSLAVVGTVRSNAPQSAKTTAIGELSATAGDVVIRRIDGTDSGTTVLAALILSPILDASFEGAPATNIGAIFNNAEMRWSASAQGQSVGGSGLVSTTGITGDLNQPRQLLFTATVGEIFNVSVSMFTGIGVTSQTRDPITGLPNPATGEFSAGIAIGNAFSELSLPTDPDSPSSLSSFVPRQAFILPEGFTADSADLNIVDNMYLGPIVAIPEPASLSLALLASAALTRRPRR